MKTKFCIQCGSSIAKNHSFCSNCGAPANISEHKPLQAEQPRQARPDAQAHQTPNANPPLQAYQAPNAPHAQQAYQAPNANPQQAYQAPNANPQQAYQAPNTNPQQAYQAPNASHAWQAYQASHAYQAPSPRASTASATGLIMGVFSLILAFILIVTIFVLPSKEDFSLLGGNSIDTSSASPSVAEKSGGTEAIIAGEYGEAPTAILAKVNSSAIEEDYYGNYSGVVSFRSDHLELFSELTGDSAYSDILMQYNGKTYECTANMDGYLRVFSPEIYHENSDGSFYSEYIWPENGVGIYEDSGYDDETMCFYYIADKAYFLEDGGLYVIAFMSAEFDDGKIMSNEIRINLQRIP